MVWTLSRGFVELKCLYLHAFHTKKRFVVNQVTEASLDFASRFIFFSLEVFVLLLCDSRVSIILRVTTFCFYVKL